MKGKILPKVLLNVLFIFSVKEGVVFRLSGFAFLMVKSVGEFSILGFSTELSDSFDNSSLSHVPVDFAKVSPCSTGVDALVNLLSLAASVPCSSSSTTLTGLEWIPTSVCGDPLSPSDAFWLLVATIGSKTCVFPLLRNFVFFMTKDHPLRSFFASKYFFS